jgi:hypothetical protein
MFQRIEFSASQQSVFEAAVRLAAAEIAAGSLTISPMPQFDASLKEHAHHLVMTALMIRDAVEIDTETRPGNDSVQKKKAPRKKAKKNST